MNVKIVYATARRIMQQLVRDHRTLGMLLLVPAILIFLLRYVFDNNNQLFNAVGGPMLAVFPFVIMFLVTSVVTLRERSGGTLERLMAMPMNKLDLIIGYLMAFSFIVLLQVGVATAVSVGLLGLTIAGSLSWLFVVSALDAILGVALGLFVSAFARTEFQAVQFMPVFVLPQFLLCGLLVPRDHMHEWLYQISRFLPLSYAIDAINRVVRYDTVDGKFYRNIFIIAGVSLLVLLLGAMTLRRRSN